MPRGSLSQQLGHADWILHRGADERVGARWTRDDLDGTGPHGVDLRDWEATFELSTPAEGVVYSRECSTDGDGYVVAEVPGDALVGIDWGHRTTGTWRIVAYGPDGERILLGEGSYVLD